MQATFQKAGDLDGLLAVKKEIERYRKVKTDDADPFEAVPEMTADVIVDAPPELRKLQEQYVASFTDAAATLKKNIADRGDKYRTQIKALIWVRYLSPRSAIFFLRVAAASVKLATYCS